MTDSIFVSELWVGADGYFGPEFGHLMTHAMLVAGGKNNTAPETLAVPHGTQRLPPICSNSIYWANIPKARPPPQGYTYGDIKPNGEAKALRIVRQMRTVLETSNAKLAIICRQGQSRSAWAAFACILSYESVDTPLEEVRLLVVVVVVVVILES